MWITTSFLGVTKRGARCLFFVLYQDYIQTETQFVKELELEIERFARSLGEEGAVVKVFDGDSEKGLMQVLDKGWSRRQRDEIERTPSILMIEDDFNKFDPSEHRWIHLHLGARSEMGLGGVYQLSETLGAIVEAVTDLDVDPFDVANHVQHEVSAQEVAKVIEIKPGALGVSIDVIEGVHIIRDWIRSKRDV